MTVTIKSTFHEDLWTHTVCFEQLVFPDNFQQRLINSLLIFVESHIPNTSIFVPIT